ncbi:metal ABC transporter permease, partial [Leptolyngbya sp. FACHB-711]
MLSLLLDPLQYGFMQRSLVVAIIVGVLCSVVGSYLVVRRMALLGDAISHSLLPGLAIAFIVGANLYLGAFVAALLSAVIISWIHTRSPIKEDA